MSDDVHTTVVLNCDTDYYVIIIRSVVMLTTYNDVELYFIFLLVHFY